MKKRPVLIAVLLTVLMLTPIARAASEQGSASVAGTGTLSALFQQITSDMTEDKVQALLSEFITNQAPALQEGAIYSGTYVHPLGYSFDIPEGYQVLQDSLGATVQLVGEADENGFASTIHVLVLDAPQEDFETLTQTKVDTYFSALLENYQFVSLDHYDYNNVTAHEFVCLHGAGEDDMMVQYSLCFNKGNKAYILTMTTLAEEATLQYAMHAYDSFIAGFSVPEETGDDGTGNG